MTQFGIVFSKELSRWQMAVISFLVALLCFRLFVFIYDNDVLK